MGHLVDNDFCIKLAQIDLLSDAGIELDFAPATTRRIAELQYRVRKLNDDPAAPRIAEFCRRYGSVERDTDTDKNALSVLAGCAAIDSGEAILFAAAYKDPELVICTGDKRAIRALAQTSELSEIANRLSGQIEILETTILRLINRHGFPYVKDHVMGVPNVDGMLRLAFETSGSTPETQAIDALRSAESEIDRLRAGLIRRCP